MKKNISSGSLTEAKKDILSLIVADHAFLKRGVAVLTSDESSSSEKRKHLETFIRHLKVHAKTEEFSLYDALVSFKQIRPEVLEGYEEHNIADTLVHELEQTNYRHEWTDEVEAKAKVLAEMIEHHVQEEEQELFPEIRSCVTPQELENLGTVYMQKRKEVRRELDEQISIPSVEQVTLAAQDAWRSAMTRVTSYVSKMNLR